ncbi:pyridoxamine 5'-phosphate oxidase [Lentilactobacillus senioris]|uniref:pyridoxamine 5'-phosphate oxidase n=1 Tax=Lentilactobacillus senioris TaxID=931534 RepID=UPI00227F9E1D|nr:pyridoxamine 5'-phosphate oxidase [Lentilactobacillus senioris]MCY9805975.1 pyridoxamine 5'-phosphate oxidase [Lentilactobacillus senioris]
METEMMNQALQAADRLALSTSLANLADVKIVNFVWYPERPGVLYFAALKNSAAIAVYEQHPDAALVTIPRDETLQGLFVRSHHVNIEHAAQTMPELLPRYLELIPGYQKIWDALGESLVAFEIKLPSAVVTSALGNKQTFKF